MSEAICNNNNCETWWKISTVKCVHFHICTLPQLHLNLNTNISLQQGEALSFINVQSELPISICCDHDGLVFHPPHTPTPLSHTPISRLSDVRPLARQPGSQVVQLTNLACVLRFLLLYIFESHFPGHGPHVSCECAHCVISVNTWFSKATRGMLCQKIQ